MRKLTSMGLLLVGLAQVSCGGGSNDDDDTDGNNTNPSATGGSGTDTSTTGGSTGVPTATGGASTGDSATGGRSTGGAATGGRSTGGAATGGNGTGGATPDGTGGASTDPGCEQFSFFVTSLVAIQRESNSDSGFGGDLGGLAGADEICRRIAEVSLPCAGQKVWRAFLSTSTEDAIDRVGSGPWYDRVGRLVAQTPDDLANERPNNADPAIVNDLPNEDGVPNHDPGTGVVDDHDTLTGSNSQGRYYGSLQATCNDWTSTASGSPRVGHSWPGGPSRNWIDAMNAPGCAAGINLSDSMGGGRPGSGGGTVGGGGGYGGFYCFALTP